MPWAALSDDFHSHPKVVTAGLDGAGLYARALSYCAHYLTDGLVPDAWVKAIGAGRAARKVVESGLWEEVEGGYLIPDFNQFNPTREYVEQQRSELSEKRAAAGRLGARRRWQTDGNAYGKDDGKQDGKGHGNAMASGWPQSPAPAPTPVIPDSSRQDEAACLPAGGLAELALAVGWDATKVAASRFDEQRAAAWLTMALGRDDVRNPGGWAWAGFSKGEWPSERLEPKESKGQNLAGAEPDASQVLDYCYRCQEQRTLKELDEHAGLCAECAEQEAAA